ncbi:MAG: hypothetical protein MZV70_07450 [Desulfobacterales bacterium]|nr:hypothetical protein [Desulfobacterales bacterium]
MAITPELLEILACPQMQGGIRLTPGAGRPDLRPAAGWSTKSGTTSPSC